MEDCRICRTPDTVGGYCEDCGDLLKAAGTAGLNEFIVGALYGARSMNVESRGDAIRGSALQALFVCRPWEVANLQDIMIRMAAAQDQEGATP